jgi:hypothetical protein
VSHFNPDPCGFERVKMLYNIHLLTLFFVLSDCQCHSSSAQPTVLLFRVAFSVLVVIN